MVYRGPIIRGSGGTPEGYHWYTNGIPVVTEANTKKQSGIPVVRQRYASGTPVVRQWYASGTPKSKKESKKENKNKITTLSSKSKTVFEYPDWYEDFWKFWVATTGNGDKKFGAFQELQTVLVGVARFALAQDGVFQPR